jgi:hypothetical protein
MKLIVGQGVKKKITTSFLEFEISVFVHKNLAVHSSRFLVTGFAPRRPGFKPGSRFVEQVFSEYLGFPFQSSFH